MLGRFTSKGRGAVSRHPLTGWLAAGLLAVALAGCSVQRPNAPVQTYDGLERPDDEVAVVVCGFSTRLLAINGKERILGQALHDRFSVLPGRHTFRVTLAPNTVSGVEAGGEPRTVTFTLEAGQVYDISVFAQPVDGHPWGIVVANRTTHTDIINPYLTRREDAPAAP